MSNFVVFMHNLTLKLTLTFELDLWGSWNYVKRVGDAWKYNSGHLNYQNQPRGFRDITICSFHPSKILNNNKFGQTAKLGATSQKWPYTVIAPGLTLNRFHEPQSTTTGYKVDKRYTILQINGPIPGISMYAACNATFWESHWGAFLHHNPR